eukprot:SAG31_NODE_15642_length_745_cov_0.797214_1_plen_203_part_10
MCDLTRGMRPAASCCAPRWGAKASCTGKHLRRSILGDDLMAAGGDGAALPSDLLPPVLPTDVGLGMGWLGQYTYVLPSEGLLVVSLGASWGESLQCRGDTADGYDDAFSTTQLWRAFRNHTLPSTKSTSDFESERWSSYRNASTIAPADNHGVVAASKHVDAVAGYVCGWLGLERVDGYQRYRRALGHVSSFASVLYSSPALS